MFREKEDLLQHKEMQQILYSMSNMSYFLPIYGFPQGQS